MTTARAKVIMGLLRQAAEAGGGPTDGQLLSAYAARRDGRAFEALVRRHGPMVLAVCRRVLRHAQDAEDAFQAAFLVLARKAGSLGRPEALAGWLHGVAHRAAWQARAAIRRRAREQQVSDMPHPTVLPDEDKPELLALLDRELAKLPESHRLPLVLCELEGRSRREAAKQLGLAEGTLSSRLARGRKMLARRMAAHGATASAAALAGLSAGGARASCVPGALVVSTVRAALGAVVPATAAALAHGVMKAMLLTKLKSVGWGLLLAASLAAGAVALTYRPAAAQDLTRTAPKPTAADSARPAEAPPARAGAAEQDELQALRLELEALRLEVRADRERIKALEDRVQAPAGRTAQPGHDPGARPKTSSADVVPGGPLVPGVAAPADPLIRGDLAPLVPDGRVTGDRTDATDLADVLADVARRLRQHPDDKRALDDLERATEALKNQNRGPQNPQTK